MQYISQFSHLHVFSLIASVSLIYYAHWHRSQIGMKSELLQMNCYQFIVQSINSLYLRSQVARSSSQRVIFFHRRLILRQLALKMLVTSSSGPLLRWHATQSRVSFSQILLFSFGWAWICIRHKQKKTRREICLIISLIPGIELPAKLTQEYQSFWHVYWSGGVRDEL